MGQLSEKELSAIQDALCDEELLVKKFQMLAEHTQDAELKQEFNNISAKHQEHFNKLYAHLS